MLLSVMMSIAISAVILVGMMDMNRDQLKSLKHFEQKNETIEIKSKLYKLTANTQVCNWQFAGKTINTQDISPLGVLNQPLILTALHSGLTIDSPKIIAVNQNLGGLKVESIQLKNLKQQASTDLYDGELHVDFSTSTIARPLAPTVIPMTIHINSASGNPNSRPIVECGGITTASSNLLVGSGALPVTIFTSFPGNLRLVNMPGWGPFRCGLKQVVTLNGAEASHVGALINVTMDGPKDTMWFVYDMAGNIISNFGSVQDGGGQARNYGFETTVRLVNRQFKIEQCSGDASENAQVAIYTKLLY